MKKASGVKLKLHIVTDSTSYLTETVWNNIQFINYHFSVVVGTYSLRRRSTILGRCEEFFKKINSMEALPPVPNRQLGKIHYVVLMSSAKDYDCHL